MTNKSTYGVRVKYALKGPWMYLNLMGGATREKAEKMFEESTFHVKEMFEECYGWPTVAGHGPPPHDGDPCRNCGK